ncbi:unnamed protein product [Effrenium voratum]|nr:unnamed protein product [Effrenium voratum]
MESRGVGWVHARHAFGAAQSMLDDDRQSTQIRLEQLANFDHSLLTWDDSGQMAPMACIEKGFVASPTQMLSLCSAPEDPGELLQTAAVQVAEALARQQFAWPRLRSFQRRAVEAWAAGRSCVVVSGTGSGKSACFTLPVLVDRHWQSMGGGVAPVALVISPLVSLMHDQAERLRRCGVGAVVCSPQGGESCWASALQQLRRGAAVIFMSPERAVSQAKAKTLQMLERVSLLAVDERPADGMGSLRVKCPGASKADPIGTACEESGTELSNYSTTLSSMTDESDVERRDSSVRSARSGRYRLLAAVLLLALIFLVAKQSGITKQLRRDRVLQLMDNAGPLGWLAYILLFSLGELLHIPGLVFVVAAVFSYGRTWGALLAYVGSITSVSIGFWVTRKLSGGTTLDTLKIRCLDRMLARLEVAPIRTVAVLRLCFYLAPSFNQAMALTGVKFRHYFLGSAMGLVPMTALATLLMQSFMDHGWL